MSRIRTIKPETPQSESFGRLSRDGRLLFVLLWTIADDAGRLRGASRMLASLLYPYDNDAPALIDGWLAELKRENCIRIYQVDGATYVEIINWLKHQKIDRPSASRLPAYEPTVASPREDSRGLDADLDLDLDLDRDQDMDRDRDPDPASQSSAVGGDEPTPSAKRGKRIPSDWRPAETDIAFAVKLGMSREEIETAIGEFVDYWTAKPDKASKLDWSAQFRNRIRDLVKRRTAQQSGGAQRLNKESVMDALDDIPDDLQAPPASAF